MWKNTNKTSIELPLTNKNLGKWRDEARVDDSASFDPLELENARKREIEFFYAKTENPVVPQ